MEENTLSMKHHSWFIMSETDCLYCIKLAFETGERNFSHHLPIVLQTLIGHHFELDRYHFMFFATLENFHFQ